VTGPGGAVAAAVAACVKASTFSCHIRVYSRRSRALGGEFGLGVGVRAGSGPRGMQERVDDHEVEVELLTGETAR